METRDRQSPAREATRNRAGNYIRPALNSTTAFELERLAHRLLAMGARPIFELLRDMVAGRDPAEIVTDFARLDPGIYVALVAIMKRGAHGQ